MVEEGELGSGGKGEQVEGSEVVLADTITEEEVLRIGKQMWGDG